MKLAHALLPSFVAPVLVVVLACGGKIADDDSLDNRQSGARGGEAPDSAAASSGGSGTTSTTPTCVYARPGMGSSATGGPEGDISCIFTDEYDCGGTERKMVCECNGRVGEGWKTGTCTCGDLSLEVACAGGCTQVSAAEYAKCGFPPPRR
jgi:hypothetical protein